MLALEISYWPFVIVVPTGVPAVTWTTSEKLALAPAAMAPSGQVIVPAVPTVGVVQPARLTDWNVVLVGVIRVNVVSLGEADEPPFL